MSDKSNNNGRNAVLFALLAIIVAALVLVYGRIGAGLKLADPIWGPATSVVTALFVTTLLVERSMAVINALLFGDRQRAAELQLLGLADPGDDQSPAQTVSAVLSSKERVRLLLSFAVGLFVAAAGVRTLQGLLATPADAATNPWFFSVDVIVTAGLISGGSNGLAFLLQLLKDRIAPDRDNPNPVRTRGAATANLQEASTPPVPPPPPAPITPAMIRARLFNG